MLYCLSSRRKAFCTNIPRNEKQKDILGVAKNTAELSYGISNIALSVIENEADVNKVSTFETVMYWLKILISMYWLQTRCQSGPDVNQSDEKLVLRHFQSIILYFL